MSTESSNTEPIISTDLQRNWRYLMVTGAIIASLGLLAVFAPFVTGISLSIFLGAFLVVGALVHVANAFSARGWAGSLWQIVLAIVYVIAGISILTDPIIGLVTLTLLVAVYLAIVGIVEIGMGLSMRSEPRWGWPVLSGVISLILAGLLWVGFPSTALWAVGLLFGISLLSSGLSLVGIALVARKASMVSKPEPPGAEYPGV